VAGVAAAESVVIIQVGQTKFEIRVQALMSVPRLAFTENVACWVKAFFPLGIPVHKGTGAFWGQVLQTQMEMHIDECEWIITVDYDTFFTRQDVELLLSLAMTHGCDAITGLQAKRSDGVPLINCPDMPDDWRQRPVVEVHAAHFGLTAINCASLRRVPKPWFLPTPDEFGSWGDSRVDDDMYFWRVFRAAGCRVFIAPQIELGHGEYMVLWPFREPTRAQDFHRVQSS
jgi:hypothetical protein